MATPTKAKPRKRASTSSGSSSRSRSTRAKSSGARKSSSSRSSTNGRSTGRSRGSTRSSNGSGRIDEARKAVAGTAQDAGQAVGNAASKAKVPLVAGGAALAGLAGGVALGARGLRRRKVLGVPVPRRSVLKASTKNLADAAREAGKVGQQMGELTTEVSKTREAMDDKHRSPIEVVLQGLTRRMG